MNNSLPKPACRECPHHLPHWRNWRLKFLPKKDYEQNVTDFLNEITQCQKHKCYLCVLESTFSSVLGLRDLISLRSYAWAYIFVRTVQQLRPGGSHKVSLSFHCTSARMFLKLSHSPCLTFCFHLQFNTQDYWYYRHEKTISFGARTRPLMHNSARR